MRPITHTKQEIWAVVVRHATPCDSGTTTTKKSIRKPNLALPQNLHCQSHIWKHWTNVFARQNGQKRIGTETAHPFTDKSGKDTHKNLSKSRSKHIPVMMGHTEAHDKMPKPSGAFTALEKPIPAGAILRQQRSLNYRKIVLRHTQEACTVCRPDSMWSM